MAENPNFPRSAKEIDALLGQRIRRRRQETRWTQASLAEEIGISFQQLQKYERGTNRVSVARLIEIADVLEAPLSYFLNNLDSDKLDSYEERKAAAFDYHLLAKLSALPDMKAKRLVLELVRALTPSADDGDP